MVFVHVDGREVGPMTDIGQVLAEYTSKGVLVELRDENGKALGSIRPDVPLISWHPELSRADVARMIEEDDGMTLDEIWKELGVECATK